MYNFVSVVTASIMLAVISMPILGMEQEKKEQKRSLTTVENIEVGSLTGGFEVLADQPLIYFKNAYQQGNKISPDPRVWYRGFGVNIVCMVPTTAVQVATDKALESWISGNTVSSQVARTFTAGVVSAPFATSIEMVVLHKQNSGESTVKVIKSITKKHGMRNLMRGMFPCSIRDGGFGVGFLFGYSAVKNKIYELTSNDTCATVGSGIVTGGVTAVVTHPADTVKTAMQSDYKKEHYKNMLKTSKAIYQKDGMGGFFKGLTPRGTRVILAITVMSNVKSHLINQLEKKT